MFLEEEGPRDLYWIEEREKIRIRKEDESIDVFWSTEVIEHMKPDFVPRWLNEADRVLRPGGLVYISTPNHDGSNDKLPEDHV